MFGSANRRPRAPRDASVGGRSRQNRLRLARHFFLAVVLLTGAAAALQLTLTLERRADGMTRYVRVDAWAVQQAEYELQLFRSRLAQHVAGDESIPVSEVDDQLARVGAALALMRGEHDDAEFGQLVNIKDTAEAVAKHVKQAELIIGAKGDLRGDLLALRRIEALLAESFRNLRQLAVDVSSIRQELQDGDLENVRWLIGANKWMLAGFFAATALFIGILIIEVRNARRAEGAALKSERRAQYLADHDALTGLPNRRMFRQHLGRRMKASHARGGEVALHLLDLDGFKNINDSYGHGFGDELLVAVSTRLSETLTGDEVLVRLAGDEFAVIQPCDVAPANWEALSNRMLAAFARPFPIQGRQIQLGTSIGVARFPSDGRDGEDLLKAADLALYVAKEERGCVRPFHSDMLIRAEEYRQLLHDLKQAISNNELELHYQPQIRLADGRCTGAEALLRWRHRVLGWVSPGIVMPIAEESGLIHPIGKWALETACRQALRWPGQAADAVIAVNVSPLQFAHDDIVELVRSTLESTGLPAERLELEITEGVLMEDEKAAVETLERLHGLGVKLAIDDFGTGYSSLSYLKRFKVDKLKIDRSFVRDLDGDGQDRMIARAIVELARGLDMQTIAEGIETPAQKNLLSALGCQEGQGYLFARAMPSSEFDSYIRELDRAVPRARSEDGIKQTSDAGAVSVSKTSKQPELADTLG